jgi:hypothetical protein
MANKERGEWILVAGDDRYTLRLTTNACCELEAFCGGFFEDIQAKANRGSFINIRLLLWAALQAHHNDLATDDDDGLKRVGDIFDAGGGLRKLMPQIKAFISWNGDMGDVPKKAGAAGAGARPRSAQAGTGVNSTLTH